MCVSRAVVQAAFLYFYGKYNTKWEIPAFASPAVRGQSEMNSEQWLEIPLSNSPREGPHFGSGNQSHSADKECVVQEWEDNEIKKTK